jgi:hypothetical protein
MVVFFCYVCYAECRYAKCRHVECHYTECRGVYRGAALTVMRMKGRNKES